MLHLPKTQIPIQEIPLQKNIKLFIKREDLIHPEISGNKYWKLFFNINKYVEKKVENPMMITFGGAFSNHISAVSALGKELGIKTLGIIRGDELSTKFLENPTLKFAFENEMELRFVTREDYRNKEKLAEDLTKEFPEALIIPEGGTNELAVKGIGQMLNDETKTFDYLCSAVGTGGTLAGISRFCEENQRVIGFKVVNDDSLENKILELSQRKNFELMDAHEGGYGKITDETVDFINQFFKNHQIPLEPIYTGKMMRKLLQLIDENYFPSGSKILAFHTGGLQGIAGANEMLRKQNRKLLLNNEK